MLNYFCFHVYAQKSLFIGENGNAFFDLLTLACEQLCVHSSTHKHTCPCLIFNTNFVMKNLPNFVTENLPQFITKNLTYFIIMIMKNLF